MRAAWISIAVISMSCARAPHGPISSDAPADDPDARDRDASADLDAPLSDAQPSTDAAVACKPANILHGDGHHNPGQDCMGSCHFHGFSLAGTLMQADGVTPASDATVTVVDANGFSQDIIAGTNGNFFSFLPVTYPVRIHASLCPSVQIMMTQATAGGCNASSCHGGAQGLAHL